MCRFASFVLTKNNEYYLETRDSHEDIIDTFHLKDDEVNVVRVELLPPVNRAEILDVTKWTFEVDQNLYPDWTYRDDPTLEEKARKALARRIEEQSIGKVIELGFGRRAVVGKYGKAIVGDYGKAIVEDGGMAMGGKHATAIAGNHSLAKVGDYGKAISENNSKSIAGVRGIAIAGKEGIAVVEDYGNATAGDNGWASSGKEGISKAGLYGHVKSDEGGTLIITNYNVLQSVFYEVISKVGENGINPGTYYRLNSRDEFEILPYQY